MFRAATSLHCLRVGSLRVGSLQVGSCKSVDRLFSTNSGPSCLTLLTPDQLTLQSAVRQVCDQEIRPHVRSMDTAGELKSSVLGAVFDAGLMAVEVDEKYGGSGLTFFDAMLVIEEVSKVDPSVGVVVDLQNTLHNRSLMLYGTEEQREAILPKLATDTVGAFCLSESDAGSDAFNLKCRASRVDGGWNISGSKQWISNSKEANFFIVFATEDPSLGHHGISAFLIHGGQVGLSIGKKHSKLGIRASSTCEVILKDVFVPESRLLGESGKGYQIAIDLLNEGRIGIGAQMVGLAQGAFDVALEYIHERKQFNQRIADFQGVQFQYAELATEIAASRLLVYNAAAMCASVADESSGGGSTNMTLKSEFMKSAAMAKLHASRTAQRVASDCVDLLGGFGFTTDSLAEKYYRDSKIGTIYEGTSNMQLLTIAKALQKPFN